MIMIIMFSRSTWGVYLWVSWQEVDKYSLALNCIKPQSCPCLLGQLYRYLHCPVCADPYNELLRWYPYSNSNATVIWMMTMKYECGISKMLPRISWNYQLYFLLMETDVNSLMPTWKISLRLLLSPVVRERDTLQYILAEFYDPVDLRNSMTQM